MDLVQKIRDFDGRKNNGKEIYELVNCVFSDFWRSLEIKFFNKMQSDF